MKWYGYTYESVYIFPSLVVIVNHNSISNDYNVGWDKEIACS